MAKIIVSNQVRFSAEFSELELREFGSVVGVVTRLPKQKKIFVNWSLPLLTWSGHDIRCAEDVLDMLRKAANWQGKLQNAQPKLGGHAHKPTILRDNGLRDQKIRFPVFAKQSAPFVQWVRNEDDDSQWLVHGYTFNDDLPSVGAYFAALTKLKEEYVKMNRVGRENL